jgi:serine/threonine protein phosphatase PrpC
MMKLFSEVLLSKNQLPTPAMEGGPPTEADLNLDSIGCTANVLLMDYELKKIYVANAGDSRCVMGHGKTKCTPLSFDHKPEC